MKKIYLANPYGFSEQQKKTLLPELVQALKKLGLEVWEPFGRNNQTDFSKKRMGLPDRTGRLQRRKGI